MTQKLVLRRGESTYSVGSLLLFCELMSIADDYDSMILLANGDLDSFGEWTVDEYADVKYSNIRKVISPDIIKDMQARLRASREANNG